MTSVRLIAFVALSVTATALSPVSADVVIYATNHQGNYPKFGDTLVKFSSDHPETYETIGNMTASNKAFGCLDFDGSGNLWAYASHNSFGGAASGLYSVNTTTGAVTQQGNISTQTLTDMAWNPADQNMYGVYSQGLATPRLYQINLVTGGVTVVGAFTGLDAQNNLVGVAFNSAGMIYLYDNVNNKFYVSDSSLVATLLYDTADTQCDQCFLAVGSQGITIDWSRDNRGYHGAVGQEQFPTYYNNLNNFALDGSSYVWGPWFGNHPDGVPVVQPGDIAIAPFEGIPGDLAKPFGTIDVFDLFVLLGNWGGNGAGANLAEPLDVVDVFDLFVLLGNWG